MLVRTGVETHGLTVSFASVDAVAGLDLTVRPGQALALVGRNGAGKSTAMRALAGVLPATSGQIRVDGVDVRADPLGARRVTGYCPDVGGLVPRASPWEHLQLSARLRGLDNWEPRARDLLERFDLAGVTHRITSGFSHGMGRRLSVVLAALHSPTVLLLDEPFDGVDPLGVDATVDLVEELRAGGTAVLVSTHLLDLAARVCSEAVVLRGGQKVAASPTVELSGPDGARRYKALLS